MPRPRKNRRLFKDPVERFYKPQGVRMRNLSVSILSHDGLEALRLADAENLSQEEAAERMNVSRPTFSRLVNEARHIVAIALTKGQALKIEGGNFHIEPTNENK